MPGRSYTGNGYRYGFNTQEKTDEVTGVKGSHTTALYWEYDTRLGRRWNVDPVVKFWQGPYSCFSGNPILRIDPLGDDDYFDSDGNFLRSDDKETHNILIVLNDKHIVKLSELRLFEGNNVKVAAQIVAYYGGKVEGVKPGTMFYIDRYSKGKVAYFSAEKDPNGIFVSAPNGQVNEDLYDYFNLMSVIDHENRHKTDHEKRLRTTYRTHFSVYLKQIFNENYFGKTTQQFQLKITIASVNHLLNAFHQDRVQDYKKGEFESDIANLNDLLGKYNISVSVNNDKKSFTVSYLDEKKKRIVTTAPVNYEQLQNPGE